MLILFNVSPTANVIRSRGLGSKSRRKELRASVVEPSTSDLQANQFDTSYHYSKDLVFAICSCS